MRLKTGIWVKAYLRRCQGADVPAMVMRHGDDDAGAVFVRVNTLDGSSLLFGPAPAGLDAADSDRQLAPLFGGRAVPDAEADAFLAREAGFDRDLWVVEIEARDGRHFLDDWLAKT